MKKKTGYEYYTNRHSCFLLQYHIVLVTKYRHPVLTGDVKTAVYERINYVAESRGFNILELNGELDHIHLLIEADPQTSPSELVNVIKTQLVSFMAIHCLKSITGNLIFGLTVILLQP